ncbi:hypothetical protein QTO34_017011 [Cnephaeus nilssonii]|uniref:Phosphofurin acidic cluster sorting protein 1/2 C-terminal domain-containing protein n=1 Tax=Cnephaeus nilssonii TaxID=3371016 RepID=A0AA40LDB6_CNENI|nr:hypothetical protein QTO34_017011 [Eptesicus nilssonii]
MLPEVCTCSKSEVQVAFSTIISWIQRHCHLNSQPLNPVKIPVAGAQQYFSSVLWLFLELLSYNRAPCPRLGYMYFLVMWTLGSHPVARYLGSVHYRYKSFFQDLARQDLFYKESQRAVQDTLGMVLRITQSMTVDKENNKKVKKTKEKNMAYQSQCLEDISRLICRAKQRQNTLWVLIDCMEWNNVKLPQAAPEQDQETPKEETPTLLPSPEPEQAPGTAVPELPDVDPPAALKMVVFKELEKDLISMVIAMKMQGSNLISMVITMKMQGYKHILWECAVPQWTTGDRFGADFTARPQLPQERRQQATGPVHWSNRFKNQIIWSYKTLPAGAIHKAEVRQQPLKGGHGLCLCSSINEASAKVAKIWICFLSSQPILQEDSAIQADARPSQGLTTPMCAVLRIFLELLSYKMLDWLGYMRFLVIPLGSHPMARHLGSVHYLYNSFFQDLAWWDLFHKLEAQSTMQDTLDIVTRITQYITGPAVPPSCPSRKPCSPTSRRAPRGVLMTNGHQGGLVTPLCSLSVSGVFLPEPGRWCHADGAASGLLDGSPVHRQGDSKKKDLPPVNITLKCTSHSLQVSRLPSSGGATATPTIHDIAHQGEEEEGAVFPKKTKDKVV